MMVRKDTTNRYRFFFHYHRHGERKMTVHFRGKCIQVDEVICKRPCETKWNKKQPRLVMRGYCKGVITTGRSRLIAVIL